MSATGAKVAVYDRYWATAGGGEKFAGGVASVLAERHGVTLLAHEPVDTDWLGERLALDLSQVDVREVGDAGRLTEASADYDLMVNLSYRSSDRSGARHGIYVVHFPHHPEVDVPPRHRTLLHAVGPVLGARRPPYELGPGFHPANVARWSKVWWTDGDGSVLVPLPPGATTTVHLLIGPFVPFGVHLDVEVAVDGVEAASTTVTAPASRAARFVPQVVSVPVSGRDDGSPVEVRVRSGSWQPDDVLGNGDTRRLGVPLAGIAVGNRPVAWARAGASLFETYPLAVDWLDSYDRILANSDFTARWIDRWWQRPSDLLYPPIGMRTPERLDAKRPVVLSVGRFFAPERGHSKKQLEMIDAWRRVLARPAAARVAAGEGWTLHLVGGCSAADRPYLDEVRAAAHGLPVEVHVDASGAELDRLYREASIYWHAAGFGEDERRHPDRMEHFGITTVEAMSAGAVPVAFAAAGPLEAFRHGREGFHFRALDELASATERLLTDPGRRRRLATAAIARAEAEFGPTAFASRLHGYVDEVLAGS